MNFRDISYNNLGSKGIDLYNEIFIKLPYQLMEMYV